MASGRVHGSIGLGVALAGTILTTVAVTSGTLNSTGAVGIAAGLVLGLFVEPDLDIDHRTRSEQWLYRIFPPLGFVWQLIWYPYALIFNHRSVFTHSPFLSTAIRMAYLGTWILGAIRIWTGEWQPLPTSDSDILFYMGLYIGLSVQDLFHVLADR